MRERAAVRITRRDLGLSYATRVTVFAGRLKALSANEIIDLIKYPHTQQKRHSKGALLARERSPPARGSLLPSPRGRSS